ncbi:MAG TPA: hypothetical protein VMM18_06365 [Gemmatimonadaceae bacterium]|nr:hypothetical protein [Gemmatimonadaceae bacterium]
MKSANRPTVALLALVAALSFTVTGCRDTGTTEPTAELGPVLILGDDRTEDSVSTILTAAGIPIRMGGPYWEYDGSGLADVSAVILLTGWEYFEDMPEAAQHAIVAFVAGGGGLMTTEWMLYNLHYQYGKQDIVAAIAPALYGDDYEYQGEHYSRLIAGHPVAQGLPQSFETRPDWTSVVTMADPAPAKQAQVVFGGSVSGDAVIAGRHGEGRTVHWSMAGEYNGQDIWSVEVRQLLVNIAKYISKRS